MTDYKIIRVGDNFYVAHKDFQRDAWRTDLLLGGTFHANEKTVIQRDNWYFEPYETIGNVKFRYGAKYDDNWVSIDGAQDVKFTWSQIMNLRDSLKEKEDRDKRISFEEGRLERMKVALTAGQITTPTGDEVTINDGVPEVLED